MISKNKERSVELKADERILSRNRKSNFPIDGYHILISKGGLCSSIKLPDDFLKVLWDADKLAGIFYVFYNIIANFGEKISEMKTENYRFMFTKSGEKIMVQISERAGL